MVDEIELVDYDPRWPRLFEEERALLQRVLPVDQVISARQSRMATVGSLVGSLAIRAP
jgi:hypothetical protein